MADQILESMQHASARTCRQDDVNADDPILVIAPPSTAYAGCLTVITNEWLDLQKIATKTAFSGAGPSATHSGWGALKVSPC